MATYQWYHGGANDTEINVGLSGAGGAGSSTPDFVTAFATWIATGDENGTTGTLNFTADGGAAFFATFSLFLNIENNGVDPATEIATVAMDFDYIVVNGPMGGGDAQSAFVTFVDPSDDIQPEGTTTASYSHSDTGANLGVPTFQDFYDQFDISGGSSAMELSWTCFTDSGVFSAHDRSLTISNLIITVTTAGAVVTDVTPTHGDKAGGDVVTLTGTGFTGKTTALFGATAVLFTPASDISGTCVSPAHAVGQVTVTVT
jgi:hypothetical protein